MKRCLDVTGTDPGQKLVMSDLTCPSFYQDAPQGYRRARPRSILKELCPKQYQNRGCATVAPTTLLGLLNVRTGGDLRGQIKSVPVTDEEVQAQGSQVKWYR